MLFFLLLCATPSMHLCAQDAQANDSTTTPFKKGRWLSGLSGTFSSSALKLESQDVLFANSSYGLDIFTGIFFKERWFAGINVSAVQSGGKGLIERESETFIIGPSIRRYFLKEAYGSLYLSVFPGFIRIREESRVGIEEEVFEQIAEGPGFAIRTRLGYSYVLSPRIILDVGVGTSLAWLDLTYENDRQEILRNESVFSNTTFFSFGFNVMLDEFFF